MTDYEQGWVRGFHAGAKRSAQIVIDMIRVNGYSPSEVEDSNRVYFASGQAMADLQREMKIAVAEKGSCS
jgi:hypothetical protein